MTTTECVVDMESFPLQNKFENHRVKSQNDLTNQETPTSKKKGLLLRDFIKGNIKKRSKSQEILDRCSTEKIKQEVPSLLPPPPIRRPPPKPSQCSPPLQSNLSNKQDIQKQSPPPLPPRNIDVQYEHIKSMSNRQMNLINKKLIPSAPFPTTGSLNLNKVKSLVKGIINENEFENTKLEKVFEIILTSNNDYKHEQDWLDAFSINEIIQQFGLGNKNLDLYNITFDDLKAIISTTQQDLNNNNNLISNTKPQISNKINDKMKIFEKHFVKKEQIGGPTNFKIVQHVGFSNQDKKLEVNIDENNKIGSKIAAKLESGLQSNSKMQIKALIKLNRNLNIEQTAPTAPERPISTDYSQIDKIIQLKNTESIFPRLPSMRAISTGSLNLYKLKQILYSKVYINGFENLKIGQLFAELPPLEYIHEKDWLDSFSVSQIVELLNPDNIDAYKITFDEMKMHIFEKQKMISNLIAIETPNDEIKEVTTGTKIKSDYDNNFTNTVDTRKLSCLDEPSYSEIPYDTVSKNDDNDSQFAKQTDVDNDFENDYQIIPEIF